MLSGGFLFAQNRHDRAPEQVQQAFHKDYPDAADASWSRSNGQWHADFNDLSARGRGEMVAHYDQDGRHIDSHIPYDRHDVPAPVVTTVHQKYRGASNLRVTKIEHPDGNALFQVQINHRGRNKTLYMDEKGQEQKYNDRH